jgi:flagellar hook-associated protein 2
MEESMGTVGLAFGSPTSGAGFNVSSTVAQIVSNLQNVETPWKTQLTAVEAQDTAISSLGTLFSNLSNDMNSLTDPEGILAQKEGSSSNTNVLELTAATSTATAGTHSVVVQNLAQTSSGYLDPLANASDALGGSVSIQVGNGKVENVVIGAAPSTPAANTIYTGSGNTSLANLASAINKANLGVAANVLADGSGSLLSLVSNTSGAAGQLTITSSVTDGKAATASNTTGALNYNIGVTGKDAHLVIDGAPLTSATNSVTNFIPGVTFQLLSPSATEADGTTQEPVQVVIANDNAGVESTVNQFVSDYNALISAINTQDGNTSSGTPEPLFGSPTLSLLQQELLGGLSTSSPSGTLDPVSSGAGVTLSGQMTLTVGSGTTENIVIGAQPSSGAAINTIYTGSGSNYNTLDGIAAAINAAAHDTPVTYTEGSNATSGTITAPDTSSLTALPTQLNGDLTIQIGNAVSQTVNMDDVQSAEGGSTLADVSAYVNTNSATLGVNAAVVSNGDGTSTLSLSSSALSGNSLLVHSNLGIPGLGATAAVITNNGQSTLALTSLTTGSSGALTAISALNESVPTPLEYTETTPSTGTTPDIGALGRVANANDTLSGSVTIQVGSGSPQTITLSSSNNTLSGLLGAINGLTGVSAALNQAGTGITLTSGTNGSDGNLAVTSNLVDVTSPTATALNYNPSSDINSLSALGISVNNNGTITLDANALDSTLNTDYSGVSGFFQNVNSWGQTFNNTLTGAGSSNPTGILGLAASSNSTIEGTLNAEISREQSLISAQQASLTAELNQANQILQQLPTQLDGINELYSAITGFNQSQGG